MAPEDNVLIVPVSRLRLPTLLLILELPPQDAYCFQVETLASWCRQRVLNSVHCPIGSVLEFFQSLFF